MGKLRSPRTWTQAEDDLLRSLYHAHTRMQIASRLSRTEGSVRSRCWILGLNSKNQDWSEEELALLRSYYQARKEKPIELEKLAGLLGKPYSSVAGKASDLGLTNQRRLKVEVRAHDLRVPKFATQEERGRACSERAKKRIAEGGHPKGMLGKKHTSEAKAQVGSAAKARWESMTPAEKAIRAEKRNKTCLEKYGSGRPSKAAGNPFSRCKGGKRPDLDDKYFRSSWEANYARYLNLLVSQNQIGKWEYEPETFVFKGVTRGELTYTPDFKITEMDGSVVYHEVKGWMTDQSKARLKRMKTHYPAIKIELIDERRYTEIELAASGFIKGWEYKNA